MDWWDDELCERLAAGGRLVHRYDHRDTGASTTFPPGAPPYDAGRLGTDALGLLDALGLDAVHLVGISMGAGISQDLAIRHPERVLSLTLLSTTAVGGVDRDLPGPTEEVQQSFADPAPDPDWADVDAFADWMLAGERTFAGRLPVDAERVRRTAARSWHRTPVPAAASNHWVAVGGDGGDDEPLDVATITAPTLVVHGDADPLFPLPHGEALADAIPGARLLVVPGMGHQVPPPETWDVVVPALLLHTSGGWDATADRLARHALAADRPTSWFEDLYAAARRGEVPMPWDRSGTHPILAPWLAEAPTGDGRLAVVVGCGLGADAEAVAARGYRTTAFDVADSAVGEARARHPGSTVDYATADLLDLPRDWRRHFDLVVEIFTVQAMPLSLRQVGGGRGA